MSDQLPATPSQKADFYCCEYSRHVGEQLFGTAPRAKVWLALEYSAAWSADAFADSTLADSVKQYLTSCLNDIPASRLQLIRRHNTESGGQKTLFVALAR